MRSKLFGWVALYALSILMVVAGGWNAPAAADPGGQVKVVETPLWDLGPNGYAGWSCPEGYPAVSAEYVVPEGAELLDMKLSEAMKPETAYPHYTTKAGETGWYVQNGETAQKVGLRITCTSPLTVVTPQKPGYDKPTCDKTGVVKVRTTEGITYETKRIVEGGITVSAKVTAVAQEGYVLAEGKGKTWTFAVAKLTGEQCDPTDEPTTPGGEPTEEPSETPSAMPTDTGSPTGSPSASSSATVVPGAVGGGTGGNLPVTGVKALTMFGVGGLLVAGGGLLLVWARRRRDSEGDDTTQQFSAI